mgnify:CR=1 FL=1
MVADVDEVLVGIAAEIAVRILKLHEAVTFLTDKGKELLVLEVVGDARGGQHLFAPEFAAPESADFGFVVIAELERLPSLIEHLATHEGIDKAAGDEAIHLRAEPTLKTHVLKRGTAHRVRHGNGRASVHANRE